MMDIRSLENESLLLLYLAGELPAIDRRELEVQLASDAAMRSQLDELRMLQSGAEATLAKLDEFDPIAPSPTAARNLSRAMARWNVERLSRPPTVIPAARRVPVWGWSIGSIAAAVLVFCVWWGFKSDVTLRSDDSSKWSTETPGPGPNFGPNAGPNSGPDSERNGTPTPDENWAFGSRRGRMPVAISMDPASESLTALEGVLRDDVQ